MRLFIAVDLGERFRHDLQTRLDSWRRRLPIAWVRPENWHLTLMFLGEWSAGLVGAVQQGLQDEALLHGPLAVRCGAIGFFPTRGQPRVLFLQADSCGALERLAAGVRRRVDVVAPDGPQDHKPFRAHLTLARIKQPLPPGQRQLMAEIDVGSWDDLAVQDFQLIKSELRREGALYTELGRFRLAGAARPGSVPPPGRTMPH